METLNISSISTKFTKTPSFPTNSISSFPQNSNYFTKTVSKKPNKRILILSKSSEETEVSVSEEDWVKNLPDKKKPLYSHSLPGIEAWLKQLGFFQSNEDRAVWFIEKNEWHAKLSLDVTDLFIRYLKSGPGNLDKDVERRFSYALSREDIENAMLGGP